MKSGWNIHYKYSEVYDTIDIIDYVGYDSIIYDDTSFFYIFLKFFLFQHNCTPTPQVERKQ